MVKKLKFDFLLSLVAVVYIPLSNFARYYTQRNYNISLGLVVQLCVPVVLGILMFWVSQYEKNKSELILWFICNGIFAFAEYFLFLQIPIYNIMLCGYFGMALMTYRKSK
ncbi:MAG: hypothetical protein J6A92_05565 [Lachnospiraceae bacterium]|nr:hypothetical protein [Lachnospiraceae bacterium]